MIDNSALWLRSKRAPFEVGPAPDPSPGQYEIVVATRAIAVGPFDRLIRTCGEIMTPYLVYPAVLGYDVAGEVTAVGAGVTRFRPGDRVLGLAAGVDKARNRATEGAFQRKVVLLERLATPLPDWMSYEQGAVLPLALSTAASGLFQRDLLSLDLPVGDPHPRGSTLLIWGGSTSVGTGAVQLAVAAGYDVVATASPSNFDLLRRLGASAVFDRRSPEVVPELIRHLGDRQLAGAVAIGKGSSAACIDVVGASHGARFVALATPPASFDEVPAGLGHALALASALIRMAIGNLSLALRARRRGVRTGFIWGSAPVSNDIGPMIFERFLPSALAEGRFTPSPQPDVAGQGLEAIPGALERQRRGVSAAKLVVTL